MKIRTFSFGIIDVFVDLSGNLFESGIDSALVLQEPRAEDTVVDDGRSVVGNGPHAPDEEQALRRKMGVKLRE